MRKLTFLVLILAAIYAGYWFTGARVVGQSIENATAAARDKGWDIAYSDARTIGFPSRFDTTVTDIAVADPARSWVWQAPFLQVFALSYAPNRVIAAFPEEQTFSIGGQTLSIAADGLRASAAVDANTALSFDTTTIEMGPTRVTSDAGWMMAADKALFAVRAQPETEQVYDVYLDMTALTLPTEMVAAFDPEGVLGSVVQSVSGDAAVTLDQPLDRHVVAPVVEKIALDRLQINWGEVDLTADGAVEIDNDGVPDGRVTLRTAQWEQLIDLMVNAGVIQPGMSRTVTNVARSLAAGGTLELPISFQSGFMSFGPIPLGPAPRFR